MNSTEIWKPAFGYEGLYEVSDAGSVRSIARPRTPGKILKFGRNGLGYKTVGPSKNGVQRPKLVHIMVLESFIGPRPPGMLGLHRDDDRSNNSLANLYWGTKSQNALDAIKNGRVTPPKTLSGEANRNCKVPSHVVAAIRNEYNPTDRRGSSTKRGLATKYGIHGRHVGRILSGTSRQSG